MSYNFKPGERTKFKIFDDYTSRGLSVWTNLTVEEVIMPFARVLPDDSAVTFQVRVEDLQPPLGFQDIYTIVVKSREKAKEVFSWLSERGGIAVFTCLDLGAAGRTSYLPAVTDRVRVTPDMKPHWSMGYVEIVEDSNRVRIEIETEQDKKPDKSILKKEGWKYDKRNKEWYKREEWKP